MLFDAETPGFDSRKCIRCESFIRESLANLSNLRKRGLPGDSIALSLLLFSLFASFSYPTRADPAAAPAAAAPTHSLQAKAATGDASRYYGTLEIEGTLKTDRQGAKSEFPLKISAKFDFTERLLDVLAKTGRPTRTLRHYETAEAKLKVGEGNQGVQLADQNKTIALDLSGRPTRYSTGGPLSREELDLIQFPGDPLAWNELLPAKAVAVEESWDLTPATVARLLGLEAAGACEVKCTLEKVKDGTAIVLIAGSGSGATNGVTSDVELRARYGFDLAQRRITWLSLSLREQRAIGRAEPGYEAVFRVQLQAAPLAAVPVEIGAAVVAKLPKKPAAENLLLHFRSTVGDVGLLLERRWYVTSDESLLQLRLVEDNASLAQCNVSRPAKLKQDERLTLDAFKHDIQETLGKNFGQFADSSEQTNEDGIAIYRVVVAGTVQEVPVIWAYYHFKRPDGDRLALVFTCESEKYETLANAETALISSLRFDARPEPTPAPEQSPEQPAESTARASGERK